MSRIAVMVHSPRRLVVAFAMLALAAAVVAGSGAVFTATSANPANLVTAGNLSHTNSKDGSAIFTASKMIPGGSTTGTVVITNDGDVPGTFSLAESNVTHAETSPYTGNLATKLTLKIEDVTVAASPITVYTGGFSGVPTTTLDGDAATAGVQPFAVGAAKTYKFTVTFPDGGTPTGALTGDNAFKKATASAQFDWTSVS